MSENRKWLLTFSQEWSEWFIGDYNWRNFTLIHAAYEDEVCLGQREITIGLLGFRAGFHWAYETDHPMKKRIERQLEELRQERS